MQLEGISEVREEENREPKTSPLTDPRISFMSVECLASFIGILNCPFQYKSAPVKK